MTVHDLPPVNAALNGISAVFLTAGWFFIRTRRMYPHVACMISAVVTSTAFLTCYLIYHICTHVLTRFTAPGFIRPVYFTLLITHVTLAFAVPPLVILTLIPALRARFDRHRRIARWTLPIWLYVSVTGVLVYMMLYQWYPPWRYPVAQF